MKIEFSCADCGADYRVAAKFAGKKVRCRTCHRVLAVPEIAEGLEEEEEVWEDPPPKPTNKFKPSSKPPQQLPPKIKKEAEPKAKKSKNKRKERESGNPYTLWIIGGIVASAALMIAGFFYPEILFWGGIGLLAVGNLMTFLHAAEDDCGLYYRFVPFYSIYYTVTRLSEVWQWAIIRVFGGVMLIACLVVHVMHAKQQVPQGFAMQQEANEHFVLTAEAWINEDAPASEQRLVDPSDADIERILKAIDWNKPGLSGEAQLTAPTSGKTNESLSLVRDEGNGPLHLTWASNSPLTFKVSPELKSLDEAIPVFVAFHNRDESWKAAIQWKNAGE